MNEAHAATRGHSPGNGEIPPGRPGHSGGGAVRTLRSLRSLRVLMAAATSSVFLRRMRVVEVREASAAAVAKAFCEPSEFHYDTCLYSPGHILQ